MSDIHNLTFEEYKKRCNAIEKGWVNFCVEFAKENHNQKFLAIPDVKERLTEYFKNEYIAVSNVDIDEDLPITIDFDFEKPCHCSNMVVEEYVGGEELINTMECFIAEIGFPNASVEICDIDIDNEEDVYEKYVRTSGLEENF